jgi:hypothetical protein
MLGPPAEIAGDWSQLAYGQTLPVGRGELEPGSGQIGVLSQQPLQRGKAAAAVASTTATASSSSMSMVATASVLDGAVG